MFLYVCLPIHLTSSVYLSDSLAASRYTPFPFFVKAKMLIISCLQPQRLYHRDFPGEGADVFLDVRHDEQAKGGRWRLGILVGHGPQGVFFWSYHKHKANGSKGEGEKGVRGRAWV